MHEVKKKRFLVRDAFNKEFGEVHPENDESLHILCSTKQTKQHSLSRVPTLRGGVGGVCIKMKEMRKFVMFHSELLSPGC